MFIDMAFGSPIYERLRALGFSNVHETNFGLVHTPDRTKANMRAYMCDKMKAWLLHGSIEADEKMAADLAGPGYHINRSNLLVLESNADMQKRGQASPDDGDALALTFAQSVEPSPRRRIVRRDGTRAGAKGVVEAGSSRSDPQTATIVLPLCPMSTGGTDRFSVMTASMF
jgi:hypothetical protein